MMQPTDDERLQAVADGIHRFDTHYVRPRHTSSLVVVDAGRAAIFDCGVPANVDDLLAAVESLGVGPEAVDYIVASHAHLDHMAGIGPLAARLPGARVVAHPSAAPHLADPSKLADGARALFGDEFFEREYAGVEPVPAERIVETADGDTLAVGARELSVLHTPGHAWHHQSLHDARADTVLAGDAFGLAYPELVDGDGPFVILPTAPPQLAPSEMHASFDRILALEPARVVPTHFAVIDDPPVVAAALHAMLDEWLDLAARAASAEELAARLADACVADLERRGRAGEAERMRELCRMDLWLNAQGLWHWRRRREEKARA